MPTFEELQLIINERWGNVPAYLSDLNRELDRDTGRAFEYDGVI